MGNWTRLYFAQAIGPSHNKKLTVEDRK